MMETIRFSDEVLIRGHQSLEKEISGMIERGVDMISNETGKIGKTFETRTKRIGVIKRNRRDVRIEFLSPS